MIVLFVTEKYNASSGSGFQPRANDNGGKVDDGNSRARLNGTIFRANVYLLSHLFAVPVTRKRRFNC